MLLFAAIAGAVAVAGFAPLGWMPLPVISLAVLAWLVHQAPTSRKAALLGFVFGLAFFLAGTSWVYVSLHDFGMMPMPLAAIATLLFCMVLACFPALAAWATAYLRVRFACGPAAQFMLLFPALWALTEWVRGWFFTGFPWLAMGYSQTDSTLAGFAPIGGVYLLSLAMALIAGVLVWMAVSPLPRVSMSARTAAVLGIAALFVAGWLLRQQAWTAPEGKPVKVALAQGNIAQSMKFEPEVFEATLATYRRLIGVAQSVDASGARLVVLPETAIPRFLDMVDQEYLKNLQADAATAQADLLLGAPLREPSREPTRDGRGNYYNAMVSIGASPVQVYRKSHLVPFGEFIPLGFGWVLDILHIPLSDFTRGNVDQKPLQLNSGLRVAVNICYEDVFGEEIIRQLPEANLLVNASNVAWFGNSLAPEQHLQISRLRAIETGRYMLRATNTGVTAIIDQRGRVVAALPQFMQGVVKGDAQLFTGATPYVRVGNWLVLGVCVVMLIAGLFTRRKNS